jgi:hypothetical protein
MKSKASIKRLKRMQRIRECISEFEDGEADVELLYMELTDAFGKYHCLDEQVDFVMTVLCAMENDFFDEELEKPVCGAKSYISAFMAGFYFGRHTKKKLSLIDFPE